MSRKQMLQQIIGVTLVVSFLFGCGSPATTPVSEALAAATATPTITPIPPTATPVPPTASGPKTGHWEGEGENVSVSFDVTTEGDIHNFEGIAKMGAASCTVELEKISAEADGTFVFIEAATNTGSGKTIEEAIRISGNFDSEVTLTGSLILEVCGDSVILSSGGPPTWKWSAEWKEP